MADDSVHLGELASESTAPARVAPDAAGVAADASAPQPRRRGRRVIIGILITLLALAVLAVIGWFVAESVLRQVAVDRVREVVVNGLGVNPDQVAVEVGGGPIVPQLLSGALERVEIDLDTMQVGAVSGAATLIAEGVPLAEGAAIERVVATVTMPSSAIAELAAIATGLPADAISVGENTVSVTSEFDVFITKVLVGVELRPSAVDGAIALEPVGVMLGDASITADELRSTPFIGAAASDLLQTRILCVADTLPASLGLTDLRIVGGELTVTLRGTAVPTDQTALAVTGSC